MDLGLSGKTAVVAGGSRGCGRGISEVLAAEGAAVVFSGRQRGPVTATETAIRAAGGTAVGVVADMTTREGALAIIRTPQEHGGAGRRHPAAAHLGVLRAARRADPLPVRSGRGVTKSRPVTGRAAAVLSVPRPRAARTPL